MLNADVIDLYERVPIGTKVVVTPAMNPIARLTGAVPQNARQLPRRMGQQIGVMIGRVRG